MMDLVKENNRRRFLEAVKNLPERGQGLHVAILGASNLGVAAGLSEYAIVEAISSVDREFKPGEIDDAVIKALNDAENEATGAPREYKRRTPVTQAIAAGKILEKDKERSTRLRAALIERGGGSVDPFSLELRTSSKPQFELVPTIPGMEGSEHRRDMLVFLQTVYNPEDILYIGNGMEPKYAQRDHVKSVEEWIVFFEQELDAIDRASDPQEQRRKLTVLGDRFTFYAICPLTGKTDEKGSLRSNACVKVSRHVLLESDTLPLDQQIALMRGLKLPIKSLTFSGSKSIHALVDVARIPGGKAVVDLDSWNAIVKKNFFGQIAPLGFDKTTSCCSHLSRFPGLVRRDKGTFQQLLYLSQNGGPLK